MTRNSFYDGYESSGLVEICEVLEPIGFGFEG